MTKVQSKELSETLHNHKHTTETDPHTAAWHLATFWRRHELCITGLRRGRITIQTTLQNILILSVSKVLSHSGLNKY